MSVLRPVELRDVDVLTAVLGAAEVNSFIARDFTDPEQVRGFVDRGLSYDGPAGTGHFVIEKDGVVAGIATLRASSDLPGGVLETGVVVGTGYWGTGLAEEATRALIDTGIALRGAVFALVRDDNARARQFAEKAGFVEVGSNDGHRVFVALPSASSGVHHVELWVADLAGAERTFGWLFSQLGWHEYQRWERGVSWRLGASYVVVEDSSARTGDVHDRTAPGINHLALHAGGRGDVDRITAAAPEHGWRLMFADRHPYAGGPHHYAAYLENSDGFEVELVATCP